jgi:small subunit ribosomal protein S21
MVTLYLDDDMPYEKAIKKFKKMCEKAEIFEEIKRRRYYTKPSALKKLKRKQSELRRQKETEEDYF